MFYNLGAWFALNIEVNSNNRFSRMRAGHSHGGNSDCFSLLTCLQMDKNKIIYSVKILLNAHTLINAHTPIWMPKMDILSESFGIPGTSNKRPH